MEYIQAIFIQVDGVYLLEQSSVEITYVFEAPSTSRCWGGHLTEEVSDFVVSVALSVDAILYYLGEESSWEKINIFGEEGQYTLQDKMLGTLFVFMSL